MALAHIPQGAAGDQSLPDTRTLTRALLLPGGGLRLSYAAGVLAEIFAHDLKFQLMDGTSGGSLNLAMLLSGLNVDEMCERWRSLKMRNTISLMPILNYLWPPQFVAASSAKGFRQKVYPHLGIDFDKIRAATGVQGSFNVCNFDKKMNQLILHQDITEDFLLAGMSLPGTLPPVTINDEVFLDSGFIQDVNVLDAVKRGANELWLIWIMGNIKQYRKNPINLYVQMLEMSANGALIKELLQIKEINARIAKGETVYGHSKPIILHMIKPARPLPLDTALYTGSTTHAELIDMGKADARRYFDQFKAEGLPFDPEILSMVA
nr:patatin-like phospholipase family protein [uncultured Undibacterium sp.]